MSRPSLNAIRVFVLAARHASFQAAANELFVTPGAVSRQIQALENQLGKRLFARSTRRVELTKAGKALLDQVGPAVSAIDDACRQVSDTGDRSAVLQLESTPTFAMHWLIPRLPQFRERYPEVRVVLRTTQGPIERGTVSQLIIRRCPSQFSGLTGHRFMEEHSLLVCSGEYLRREDVSCAAAIARSRLIGIRSRQDLWPKWFAHHGLPEAPGTDRMEFDNTILAIQAATQGLGIAFIPYLFVDAALASGALTPIPGLAPIQTDSYHWLSPLDMLPRSAEAFLGWLETTARAPFDIALR